MSLLLTLFMKPSGCHLTNQAQMFVIIQQRLHKILCFQRVCYININLLLSLTRPCQHSSYKITLICWGHVIPPRLQIYLSTSTNWLLMASIPYYLAQSYLYWPFKVLIHLSVLRCRNRHRCGPCAIQNIH